MLLEVIESTKESINDKYKLTLAYSYSNLANQAGHTQSQKTVNARKDGMFYGKIISSHLMGKAVNNHSQFWK